METEVDSGVDRGIWTNGRRRRYSARSSEQESSRSAKGCDKKKGTMMKMNLKDDV